MSLFGLFGKKVKAHVPQACYFIPSYKCKNCGAIFEGPPADNRNFIMLKEHECSKAEHKHSTEIISYTDNVVGISDLIYITRKDVPMGSN